MASFKDAIVNGIMRVIETLTAGTVNVTNGLTIPTTPPANPKDGDVWLES